MSDKLLLPLLPLRDIVVFPHMVSPLFVGREKSVLALEKAMTEDKTIILAAQIDATVDDPSQGQIYDIGTIATILQLLKLPDGTVRVLVEGKGRVKIQSFSQMEPFFEASATLLPEDDAPNPEILALAKAANEQFANYAKLNRKIPPEITNGLIENENASSIADIIAANLGAKLAQKQDILASDSVAERLEKIIGFMDSEIGALQLERKVRNRVKRQMEKSQREYYLNEQMKAIQKELGETESERDEMSELEYRIKQTKFTKDARTKANAELKKLRQMSPMSAESTVVRNYLDWLLALPWGKMKKVNNDINRAQTVLDDDHYGLEKVKERILEYLAVQGRVNKLKGPILCLVGPPGVGKTSLGKSIANATGRDFVRVALGGVRDEAEIRGHRRTYIGSLPGRIIQSLKKAKSNNPLFLLDEIDKLGADFRGDPASALLEVLDPEQNSSFNDHYLELDYDLSNVMFVTTANSLNIHPALLDRMEIIRLPGYTEGEKLEIAKRHLLPKQLKEHGVRAGELEIADSAILALIQRYTRESGVRNLEREIANLARKAIREISQNKSDKITIDGNNIADYAGVPKFRFDEIDEVDQIGAVTGLAWTEVGGDTLTIEAIQMFGKGRMTVTGNLKDVMKESISAASSFVRARAPQFGIMPTVFEKTDIHVHVPEAATPKDGPSAGVGMMTAIVSLLTNIPVSRSVAMTGEITLRGRVLAIGGLKEKLLAALRAGVKTVLIPKDNEKDLADIPDNVKNGLTIIAVSSAEEVLEHALVRPLIPIDWTPEDQAAALRARPVGMSEGDANITH
ncbi:MAG: ATP-dependent Lon protease [Hyphomonadaceae bacterium]|nr:MAG: ATP-dependent Lon protease [Hyphomonadaceae bacterium]KAF0185464.1 MAG: ATP-dependent Lon protease [Hyphomonadaceae bacterium]